MGWAGAFLGEGIESDLNSFTEGVGLGDVSEVASTKSTNALGGASGSNWWEKGIKQMMPAIMGASLKPKQQLHAPVSPGGHGIQASGGTAMQPFQEVTKMADDNPLSNIHQWSNLFG